MRKNTSIMNSWILITLLLLSTLGIGTISLFFNRPCFAQTVADQLQAEAQKKIDELSKKAQENIIYIYNSSKNSTIISTNNEKVQSQSEIVSVVGDLFLFPIANVVGEVTKKVRPSVAPDKVLLFFIAEAPSKNAIRYKDSKKVTLLVDEKPLGTYRVIYRLQPNGTEFIEKMSIEMSYADFWKLAAARASVEGFLDDTKFKFNYYQRILYRIFLIQISPLSK